MMLRRNTKFYIVDQSPCINLIFLQDPLKGRDLHKSISSDGRCGTNKYRLAPTFFIVLLKFPFSDVEQFQHKTTTILRLDFFNEVSNFLEVFICECSEVFICVCVCVYVCSFVSYTEIHLLENWRIDTLPQSD